VAEDDPNQTTPSRGLHAPPGANVTPAARPGRLRAFYDWLVAARPLPDALAGPGLDTAAREAAARVGSYTIVRKLGQGGMGIVYAARDERLGRTVALKMLSRLAHDDAARQRFWREARAAASVNHPNVCQLYEIGEDQGALFITMELLEGETLGDRLRKGPLRMTEAVPIGLAVLAALSALHERGIVHRDLKPSNVFLTPHGVKLLDFGLARRRELGPDESAPDLTGTGMMLGTPRYMAPEQVTGDEVDPRSDLFGVGAILYEMLAGRPAFAGRNVVEIIHATLHEEPPPLEGSPALVAADRVIRRALGKRPSERPASAEAMAEELRAAREAGGADTPPRLPAASSISGPRRSEPSKRSSVAVLPFHDLSQEKDQQYLCQGLAEELISSLGTLVGVRVVARTSAFAVHAQGLDVREIGSRLQVDTVLEGSVRKAGRRLRVTTQLVDATDGYQIWSRRFDRELDDVFAVQDQIAETVASELRAELGASWQLRAARHTPNVEAHEAYLRGLHDMNRWTEDAVDRALGCFEEATRRDPAYALAHAALAECFVWFYSGIGTRPARLTIPRAREAARRAASLAPGLPEAHKVTALIAMNHDWDRVTAERSFARAIELNPAYADARVWNGWRLSVLEGRHQEALAELRVAETLDPLDLKIKTQVGYVYYFLRDLDRAAAQFKGLLDVDPRFAFAHYALADVHAQQGRYADAAAGLQESMRLGGSSVNHLAILAYVHGLAGRASEARALLAQIAARAERGEASPIWAAVAHIGLREHDAAFGWLERAFQERDGSLVLVAASPEFDPLRKDPRLRSLLERMGLGHRA
jgi:serine/threonine protein kinase/tetratricopeptide (TPR) repeat protein